MRKVSQWRKGDTHDRGRLPERVVSVAGWRDCPILLTLATFARAGEGGLRLD